MKEWIDALKKGSALRFLDAVEPDAGARRGARGVLGTSADGAWVLVDALGEVHACNAELGEWRRLARGSHPIGACFAGGVVVIAWEAGRLVGVDLDGNVAWSKKAAPKVGAINRLWVDASGEIVVAHAHACVRWLDPETGDERRRRMLDTRSGRLREFDGETGKADGPEYKAVVHEVIVGVDPSGRHALGWLPMLYVGPHHPGDLRLWDLTSGSCTAVKNEIIRPGRMLIGPGARWALSWSIWAAIDLWDLTARKRIGNRPVSEQVGTTRWGPNAAMSPDGRHWVSAVECEICLWEMSAESPIDRIEMPSYPSIDGAMAFSPDGKTLYLCLEGRAVRLAVDLDVRR